jgi:ABC-type dipeptide/oligopeptide/nickel transport system ATPase component
VLFITHDIGQACYLPDRVLVMGHGVMVEQGTTDEVTFNPQHGYTERLLADVPSCTRRSNSTICRKSYKRRASWPELDHVRSGRRSLRICHWFLLHAVQKGSAANQSQFIGATAKALAILSALDSRPVLRTANDLQHT